MTPVWIIGSNVDTSSPLVSSSEKLDQESEERSKNEEDRKLNKQNSETFEKISTNIRGLVRGFTSLFKGGLSYGSSSSGTTASASGDSTSLTGDSNQAKVWNFFKQKGLSDEAVAGIMGNIEQESRFQTNASESGSTTANGKGGYGLIQWTGDRRQKLFAAAQQQGKDVNDLDFQLNYLWDEALSSGYYKNALEKKGFFTSKSVDDTTLWFHNIVEGSADTASMIQKNRIQPANKYYNQFKGTSSSSSTNTTSANSSGSTVNLSTGNTTSNTGSSAIDKAVAWAVNIANDNSHGYSQANRNGPDYDCSSLVITAYKNAGLNLGEASYTGNMLKPMLKAGFTDVTSQTNHGKNVSALKKGDVLLNPSTHTEMYIGNGQKVGAHSNYDGKQGDSNSREIRVDAMSGTWDYILRPPGTFTEGSVVNSTSSSGSVLTGLGVFDSTYAVSDEEKAEKEANDYWKQLRDSGGHAYNSVHNDTAKGKNKAKQTSGNTSGWKSSYNKDMSSLKDFSNNKTSLDSRMDTGGKNPYQNIIDRNENGSSLIYTPSGGTTSGDNTSSGGNGNTGNTGGSTVTNPSKPDNISDDHKKYYEKLVELLALIEKNTSNIPITNKLLNEIIKLLDEGCCGNDSDKSDNSSSSDTKEPNTNIMESLFGSIDSDISLIATGI